MDYYIAVIEKDPDSTFGVSFPQLETVFSAGDSMEDATKNAAEALQLFFEDCPADRPDPWTMDRVSNMEDVQQDVAKGAILVAIPFVALTGKSSRVNLTFDAGLLSAIETDAKAKGITRAAWLSTAARAMLNA